MTAVAVPIDSHEGLISRPRLVRRLIASRDVPLVLLVAPSGYGKTTLLREWALEDGRPFVWLDVGDICESIPGTDVVLVLDGADALHAPESWGALSDLVEQLRPGSQLALAARTEPGLGLGGLRARRKVVELRSADLAMTPSEAAALVDEQGLDLEPSELDVLVHRTEGWPAGLCLAALAACEEPHPGRALARFGGDDRFVADYFRDEVLTSLAPEELAFLARTSVLDRLSGPVCDYVLERGGSGRLLKSLSRMNLMLVPLDRTDSEYRYHRLFGQTLRAELHRSEPEVDAILHRRASVWYGDQGDVERSIAHAVAAGDVARAGDLLWSHTADILGYGHGTPLRRYLAQFSSEQVAGCTKLALAAAASGLMDGDRNLVEHWTTAALRGLESQRPIAERRSLEGQILLLRATVDESRVSRMGKQAEAACAHVPDDSPWRALGNLLQGVAHHLTGDRERARRQLEEGARLAAVGSPSMQSLCLAQLGLLAVERRDWAAAESHAVRARAQVERSGFGGYATSALVYAVSAEVQAHAGRIEASKASAREAGALLASLTDFSPWYEAECRIALARAALRLSDVRQARELISEAGLWLQRAPDATVAHGWVQQCRSQAELSSASSAADEWCLTTAELRILQFLPTHLSLREIAERLYVSANTVKTHARSVYRKLGASSRGGAVVAARDAGLLDEASHAGVGATPISPDLSDARPLEAS
jgi:LuxR family maltose regulon positive regulatory protein